MVRALLITLIRRALRLPSLINKAGFIIWTHSKVSYKGQLYILLCSWDFILFYLPYLYPKMHLYTFSLAISLVILIIMFLISLLIWIQCYLHRKEHSQKTSLYILVVIITLISLSISLLICLHSMDEKGVKIYKYMASILLGLYNYFLGLTIFIVYKIAQGRSISIISIMLRISLVSFVVEFIGLSILYYWIIFYLVNKKQY